MFRTRYDVRIVSADGELVTQKRFIAKDAALNFLADKLIHRRRAKVARKRVFVLETFSNSAWSQGLVLAPNGPWQTAPGPYAMCFLHTAVTQQLPMSATVEQERQRMRLLHQIALSRGFNGISYSWIVFPSGRAWEGRGDFVVEAATEGFNTTSDSICFDGNGDAFAPNESQLAAAKALINRKQANDVYVKTGLNVRGHREVSTQGKSCPGTKFTDAHIASIQKAVNA